MGEGVDGGEECEETLRQATAGLVKETSRWPCVELMRVARTDGQAQRLRWSRCLGRGCCAFRDPERNRGTTLRTWASCQGLIVLPCLVVGASSGTQAVDSRPACWRPGYRWSATLYIAV